MVRPPEGEVVSFDVSATQVALRTLEEEVKALKSLPRTVEVQQEAMEEIEKALAYVIHASQLAEGYAKATHFSQEALILTLAGYQPGQFTEEIEALKARVKILNNPALRWEIQAKEGNREFDPKRYKELLNEIVKVSTPKAKEQGSSESLSGQPTPTIQPGQSSAA